MKIDWDNLILHNIPVFMRKLTIVNYLKASISQTEYVYRNCMEFAKIHIKWLVDNSQVYILVRELNKGWDNKDKRIVLSDSKKVQRFFVFPLKKVKDYVYPDSASKPIFIFSKTKYNTPADFYVNLPASIYDDGQKVKEIRNYLNLHIIAGYKYGLKKIT